MGQISSVSTVLDTVQCYVSSFRPGYSALDDMHRAQASIHVS